MSNAFQHNLSSAPWGQSRQCFTWYHLQKSIKNTFLSFSKRNSFQKVHRNLSLREISAKFQTDKVCSTSQAYLERPETTLLSLVSSETIKNTLTSSSACGWYASPCFTLLTFVQVHSGPCSVECQKLCQSPAAPLCCRESSPPVPASHRPNHRSPSPGLAPPATIRWRPTTPAPRRSTEPKTAPWA